METINISEKLQTAIRQRGENRENTLKAVCVAICDNYQNGTIETAKLKRALFSVGFNRETARVLFNDIMALLVASGCDKFTLKNKIYTFSNIPLNSFINKKGESITYSHLSVVRQSFIREVEYIKLQPKQ